MSKIYIENDEEITSVVKKIIQSPDQEVDLYIPKAAIFATSLINLKILAREIKRAGKKVIINSPDENILALAAKASLGSEAVPDKESQENNEEITSPDSIRVSNYANGKQSLTLNGKPKKTSDQKLSPKDKSSLGPKLVIIFIVVAVVIAILIIFLVLPKAEIIITSATEDTDSSFTVTLDADINEISVPEELVPATLEEEEYEAEETFEATGEKNVGERATGTVIIFNNYQTSSRTISPTNFQTPSGLSFTSTKTVEVPGYVDERGSKIPGQAQVEVIADEPGEEYNIEPSRFAVVGLGSKVEGRIYAESAKSFTGGTTENVTVVSADDITSAKNSLAEKAKDSLSEIFSSDDQSLVTLPDFATFEETGSDSDKKEDEEAEEFKYTTKYKIKALFFDREVLTNYANAYLTSLMSDIMKRSTEMEIVFEGHDFDSEKEQAILDVDVKVIGRYEVDVDETKNIVAGKSFSGAQDDLERDPAIAEVEIKPWPFWVKKVPSSMGRIEVEVR